MVLDPQELDRKPHAFDLADDRNKRPERRSSSVVMPSSRLRSARIALFFTKDREMYLLRIQGVAFGLFVASMGPLVASAQAPKVTKVSATKNGVRCAGILFRTDFGHPQRLAELAYQADAALANSIDSGKTANLVDAFDEYLKQLDMELGESERRDVVRSRLAEVLRSVANDDARSAHLLEGFRKFTFAAVLRSKGLNARSIEEVRQALASIGRAVPADSFCLLPIELYLASMLEEVSQSEEAVTISQSVITRVRAKYGKRDDFLGIALVGLGKAQMAAGDAQLAEVSLREALDILANALEIQPDTYLLDCNLFAESMLAQSKFEETADLMAQLDPQIRKFMQSQLVPPVLNAATTHAKSLTGLGRFADAEKVLGEFPSQVQSLKEPGVAGRNLLDTYAVILEKTNRAEQAVQARKRVALMDVKLGKSILTIKR
jgi:tetratricopeptide (TPR) repeat protein